MKKKFVALSLAMVMAATTAACGAGASNNTPASSSNSNETEAPAEENTEPAADTEVASSDIEVTGDSRTLSLFAGSIPENTPTGAGLEAMAAYINANSNGTLEAQTFYDTALGDATSMVQGLQQGTVDIGISGTAYFTGLVPVRGSGDCT